MIPVPVVDTLLDNISSVKKTYAMTVSRTAVDRYIDSD
jgi:hypothetical protein